MTLRPSSGPAGEFRPWGGFGELWPHRGSCDGSIGVPSVRGACGAEVQGRAVRGDPPGFPVRGLSAILYELPWATPSWMQSRTSAPAHAAGLAGCGLAGYGPSSYSGGGRDLAGRRPARAPGWVEARIASRRIRSAGSAGVASPTWAECPESLELERHPGFTSILRVGGSTDSSGLSPWFRVGHGRGSRECLAPGPEHELLRGKEHGAVASAAREGHCAAGHCAAGHCAEKARSGKDAARKRCRAGKGAGAACSGSRGAAYFSKSPMTPPITPPSTALPLPWVSPRNGASDAASTDSGIDCSHTVPGPDSTPKWCESPPK